MVNGGELTKWLDAASLPANCIFFMFAQVIDISA